MSKGKTIAFFTSIRSEYGSLNFLLREFERDRNFESHLLVGGAHLLPEHGNTINEILADGHEIKAKLPFLTSEAGEDYLTQSMSKLTAQVGLYFRESKPDLIFLVGDRFELLPVASVALVMNVPIAHISGGEVTEGAIDNQVRNAVSKMSNIHFVAASVFKQNLIQMGEDASRVFVSGELGLDQIEGMRLVEREALFADLGLSSKKLLILSTFHPETITGGITTDFLERLFCSIHAEWPDAQILSTASNFDMGGKQINDFLKTFSASHEYVKYVESLGKVRYFSVLKNVWIVIGNSSSAIYEVQSFNIPSIDIGDRQKGRLSNPNVIHARADVMDAIQAIHRSQTAEFREGFLNKPNVYGAGNAAAHIREVIAGVNWDKLGHKHIALT